MTQEEQEYQEHYSPDGEYLEYLMEHPEIQEEMEKLKNLLAKPKRKKKI